MIEPTDDDICEALGLHGYPTYSADRVSADRVRSVKGTWELMILAHAHTLAKLRMAMDALEAVTDTDGHQSYATQLSEACDIAHTTLTQIKDEKP